METLKQVTALEAEIKEFAKKITAKEKELSKRLYAQQEMFDTTNTPGPEPLFDVPYDQREAKRIIQALKNQQQRKYAEWVKLTNQLGLLRPQPYLF